MNEVRRLRYILMMVCGLVSGVLYAEQSDTLSSYTLDEVVVTTHRYNRNVRNIAAPFQIIPASRLEQNDIGSLVDALQSVPGVQLQTGTFQTNRLTIRGIGSRSPYGTTRTRAYIDDIPLTAGDGTTIFDDLELSFVQSIEVTKGPHSAWYGSGIGGSLRFVTLQQPESPIEALTQASVGSYGLSKIMARSRFKEDFGFLNVGIVKLSGDGYRENSSFLRNSMLLSGEFESRRLNSRLNYLLTYSGVNAQTPSSINEETFLLSPSSAAPNWLNVKGFKQYDRILSGIKITTPITGQLENKLTFSGSVYDQYELRPFNILDDQAVAFTVQESVLYTAGLFNVSGGLEWQHENYRWHILENVSEMELQHSLELRNQYNAFFSVEARLQEEWLLSLAGNINATQYRIEDLFAADGIDYSGEYFNKLIFSPKLGVSYRPDNDWSLYGSVGHGFSNPTVEESLSSDGMLNTALRPEQGWTFDVGAKGFLLNNKLRMEASLYYIALTDLLVTKRLSEDVFFGENAGSSRLKGIELQIAYRPSSIFQTLLSFNASDHRFANFTEGAVDHSGNVLPGIPSLQSFLDLQFHPLKQLQLNLILKHTGSQYADDANTVAVDSWQTVDLRAAYTQKLVGRLRMQLSATANNLFNEHYASMILINAPSFGANAPRYYYPGMPRNFLFTLKLIW